MKTIVLKFGGTSVGTIDRVKKVCKIIAFYKKKKNRVLVVSSAILENLSISFLFMLVIVINSWHNNSDVFYPLFIKYYWLMLAWKQSY